MLYLEVSVVAPAVAVVMFIVKQTEFSGLGVFSTRSLPAGTLIIREKPLLEVDPWEMKRESLDMQNITLERHKDKNTNKKMTAIKVVKFCKVMEKFMKLEKDAKRQYLSLKDSFNYLDNVDEFELDINTIDVSIFKEIISVSREVAAKVWGIFNTNNFENGVYFHLSRVNHSCSPNAEFVWNQEEKTQDLRLNITFFNCTIRFFFILEL